MEVGRNRSAKTNRGMIRYKIKAGKLSESGVVDTFRELTNRLKAYTDFKEYSLKAKQEDEQQAGRLQNDRTRKKRTNPTSN